MKVYGSTLLALRGAGGCQILGKKRYVTLEWALICMILVPGDTSSPGGQRALGDEKQVEEAMVPLPDTGVKPRTVVVEPVDAAMTLLAVTGPQGLLKTQVDSRSVSYRTTSINLLNTFYRRHIHFYYRLR